MADDLRTFGESTVAWNRPSLERIRARLVEIRSAALDLADKHAAAIGATHPAFRASARNLVHYLSLRQHDLRALQADLAELGLSSLGRSEPHVLPSLNAVIHVLNNLLGMQTSGGVLKSASKPFSELAAEPAAGVGFNVSVVGGALAWVGGAASPAVADGWALLDAHTDALLGPPTPRRRVRMMVTLPTEAANDPGLVRDILAAGAESVRINCAHDDAATWARMVAHVRAAEQELGTACCISMDLAGPKLRTGAVAAGPRVVHSRPKRDLAGAVVAPARVWLTADINAARPSIAGDVELPVPADWLSRVKVGDELDLADLRDRTRRLVVVEEVGADFLAHGVTSTYVGPGAAIRIASRSSHDGANAEVGDLTPTSGVLLLREGDHLVLTGDDVPGVAATRDADDRVVSPARIACTLPEVFRDVQPGERVLFDDGKIGGRILSASATSLDIQITEARPQGSKLRADKGINFPDSDLHVAMLTPKDLEDLDFVAEQADLVALSFVSDTDSIEHMRAELTRRTARPVGLVLKIETQRAFSRIPRLLLAAMRTYPAGVMIARGDLAVEVGFERLAEVQEELLWLCEAAHVPAIWATQVLESLAQKGIPSRAEISDAAMSDRAECVMLNKGPFVVRAEHVLDNILCRMQEHQHKKRPELRKLSVSSDLDTA